MDPAERMRALLRYANSAKVARGLSERGYSVSEPTVSRWAKGRHVTQLKLQLVADLLGTTEEAAPDWERLMWKMDAIAERLGVSLDEERAVAGGADAALPPPPDDGSAEDPQADDSTGARQPRKLDR